MKWTFLHKIKQHYKKTGSPLDRLMLEEPDIDASELARIQIPVLVLAGSSDIIKPAHTKLIAESLPYSQLRIIEGEDHGSYIIHSSKLYSKISDWV